MNIKHREAGIERLDFSVLPFDETAAHLGNLGETLLADLLYGHTTLVSLSDLRKISPPGTEFKTKTANRERPVEKSEDPVKFDAGQSSFQRLVAEASKRGKRAIGHAEKLFRPLKAVFDSDARFENIAFKAMTGGFSEDEFAGTIKKHMTDDCFGGLSPDFVPTGFLRIAGEKAWRDLRFQRDASVAVRKYFKEKILFTLDDETYPSISPNTYWILIALAKAETPEIRRRDHCVTRSDYAEWLGDIGSIVEYHETVARIGKTVEYLTIHPEGWAGFWDQWAIWKAKRLRPDAFKALGKRLRPALLELPFFEYMGAGPAPAQKTGKHPPIMLTEMAWEKDIPKWFDSYRAQYPMQGH